MERINEIYQQMKGDFVGRTGVQTADGCDLAARMYALAAQIYGLEVQSDWIKRQCFPQTAQGEYLDHHAQVRGLERKQATQARGVVRFYAQSASELVRTIPVGTVCMTAGLVRFETVEEGILAAGEMWTDVPVQALEPGSAGNVGPGAICDLTVAPVGIAYCGNPAACTGGTDGEDDESLRRRVLDSFRALPNGANAAYYRQLALSGEDVAGCTVVPRPRGVGSVDVVVASRAGVPEETLIAELQQMMEQRREIAVDVLVRAPETVPVDVQVQVKVAEGADAAAVRGEVEQALRNFFTGERLGESILLARLGGLVYGCKGVVNYAISAPNADVAVAADVLPVLGTLTVEGMA